MIASPKNSQLDRMSVHTTAVRAVQVGENDLTMIFLQLGVQPTDTFIVQLNHVVFFTANRDRRFDISKDSSSFQALQH